MAKKSKSTKSQQPLKSKVAKTPLLSERKQDYIFIAVLAALLVFLLKPMVIDRLSPQGVDVLASVATNHQVMEWQDESGEKALWNPNLFAGMPRYQRFSPVTFGVDTVLNWLGKYLNNVFVFYLFGAIGMFLLLRHLKLSPSAAFFGAAVFVLMPHFKALYLVGHIAKLRAVMVLPWIVYAFLYFLDRRSLLGAAFFALAFGMQIRTQHYQIVFYTGLLIFAIGIYPVLKDLIDKNYKRFASAAILIIAAVTLGIMTAAQPLFLAKEYLPWSKRGKTTIDLANPQATEGVGKTNGVSIEYATQWSTPPNEVLTWFVPRIYGGMSQEKYTGDAVQQLKGRDIPGYWGEMPFTQSYEYMGVITLLLALIGFYYNRKNKLFISFALFAGFLTLLSFGRHAEWFYSLFYHYVPFFNKFRAPMMAVTVTFFIVSFFAGFGLKALYNMAKESFDVKKHKPLLIIVGGFFGLGILIWFAGQGFSFVKGTSRYDEQTLAVLKTVRKEMFDGDMLRYLALVALSGIGILAFLKQKLPFIALAILLTSITVIDLINVQSRTTKDYINIEKLEKRYFRETATDIFLKKDKSVFRVFPLGGQMFRDNRWAYHHQTLGGYTPIKMFAIEEMVQNNLRNGELPNRAVMKILNVKYLVAQQQLNQADLSPVNVDTQNKLFTYRYNDYLARGYFVGKTTLIEDEFERVKELNKNTFKPDSIAIVEIPLHAEISVPDSSSAKLASFSPNHLTFDVYTDKQALFVISELYYPPGWKLFIDDQQVDAKQIYKTNHAVQSAIVPEGSHTIHLKFDPDSYANNILYASGSLALLYLVIASSIVQMFLKKKQEQQV